MAAAATNWRISNSGGWRYFTEVGPLEASIVLQVDTRTGGDFAWRVEVRGAHVHVLHRGGGLDELFDLVDIGGAKKAALEFAEKILTER